MKTLFLLTVLVLASVGSGCGQNSNSSAGSSGGMAHEKAPSVGNQHDGVPICPLEESHRFAAVVIRCEVQGGGTYLSKMSRTIMVPFGCIGADEEIFPGIPARRGYFGQNSTVDLDSTPWSKVRILYGYFKSSRTIVIKGYEDSFHFDRDKAVWNSGAMVWSGKVDRHKFVLDRYRTLECVLSPSVLTRD